MDAHELIEKVASWSRRDDRVIAVGICGSHARGEARPDSDIDFCILTSDPDSLLEDRSWITGFGSDARMAGAVEDYNLVQSIRVFYGETEAEFGVTDQAWMELPVDHETASVMNDGLWILYDPAGRLKKAIAYAASLSRLSPSRRQPQAQLNIGVNGNDMRIRDATESDLAAMYAVDHMASEEGSRRQHIREWVGVGRAIVALIDEVVVGYAALEYTFSNGFISMLMVDRASRRKGVAAALVKYLEEVCETDKLFTSTNESNKPMQGLMQSMSYEPSGTVYNLDEGDPELFYFKRLERTR